MFATTLPVLPPPSTSLLPSLHPLQADVHSHNAHPNHPHQRRPKHVGNPRSTLSLLSLDERAITQRKLAIAMYGYSWLKPAGCGKTMLGRREEELEREEVERQLREVEMQERVAAEGEEAERLAAMRQQEQEAEANGGMLPGERDLDEDIPEAEEVEDEDEEDEDAEDLAEEDMEGDLDDEIPEADVGESSWVYDTNRDSDTESEEVDQTHLQSVPRQNAHATLIGVDNADEAEAMINAMLDEDELGEFEHHHDLDDDLPDMDADMDMDMDMDMDADEHNLDDDVPEAEDEEEWQHTDTELEESEMDISMLPPAQSVLQSPASATSNHQTFRSSLGSDSIGPGTTHEEMRRTSGNIMMPPPSNPPISRSRPDRRPPQPPPKRGGGPRNLTPQIPSHFQTPVINTNDSISNLISMNESSIAGTDVSVPRGMTRSFPAPSSGIDQGPEDSLDAQRQQPRGRWLNPAGARRNLFGGLSRGTSNSGPSNTSTGSGFTPDPPTRHPPQGQVVLATTTNPRTNPSSIQPPANTALTSSSALFTPEAQTHNVQPSHHAHHGATAGVSSRPAQQYQRQQRPEEEELEEPRSRTRSGRLLGGIHMGRRLRRGQ